MKMLPLLAVVLTSSAFAGERPPTPASPPLRPTAECLVPDQVKNWGVIDERRLVVETLGQRYYDIQLTSDCGDLQTRPRISFRNGASMGHAGSAPTLTQVMGANDDRICGDINDAVIAHGSAPGITPACDIARIRRIDGSTFEAVFNKSGDAGNALLDAAATIPAEPALVSSSD